MRLRARYAFPLVCLLLLPALLAAQSGQTTLPARLGSDVTKVVKLTPAQLTQLFAGQPVTQLLDADPSHEVSIFGAIWVKAPISRYVAAVRDIEQFEKGENFRVTKKVSTPPRLEDFSQLALPPDDSRRPEDVQGWRLRVESQRERTEPVAQGGRLVEADRHGRRRARRPATASTTSTDTWRVATRGWPRIATRAGRPSWGRVPSMVDRMPSFSEYLPDLKRYLLNFPKATLPKVESFVYWQETQFGLKPTIRSITWHQRRGDGHGRRLEDAVCQPLLLDRSRLRVLVPDPSRGEGFWFASVNRSRSDGLSGFVGSLIRGKVRDEAEKGTQSALSITKTMMEKR